MSSLKVVKKRNMETKEFKEFKNKVVKILNDEMWFPNSNNEKDWEVAKKLNAILSDTIIKILKL